MEEFHETNTPDCYSRGLPYNGAVLGRPVLVYTDSLLLDLALTGVWSELGDPLRVSYAAKLRKNLFAQV
jgi:hypothetical protein